MDDLISRQAAIDAVNERIKQIGYEKDPLVLSIRQAVKELPSAQRYTDEEVQKIQDLEQLEIEKAFQLGREDAQLRWIPCSERLPENSDFYYVTVKWRTGKKFTEECSYNHEYKEWNDGKYDDYGAVVIAWMKTPEPWEGGQDNG